MGGIEPVLAHEALGALASLGNLSDVKAGCIGGQQRLLGGDLGNLAEEALLDIHALNGGLHHQTAVPEAFLVHSEDHALQSAFGFLGGNKAFLYHHLLIDCNQMLAFFKAGFKQIIHVCLITSQCIDLSQRCAHNAGTSHHNFILIHLNSPISTHLLPNQLLAIS